mgnify:CR=1 FL=1
MLSRRFDGQVALITGLFLASDAAGAITGQNINAANGYEMR